MVPDKIYLRQYDTDMVVFLNKYNIDEEWTEVPINDRAAKNIEYIRKDTLLEWVKNMEKGVDPIEKKVYQTIIDKLNSI